MFRYVRGISLTSREPDERRRTGQDGQQLISPSGLLFAAGDNSAYVAIVTWWHGTATGTD